MAVEFITSVICALGVLLVTLYIYGTSTFNYWKKRGVPQKTPLPIIGNSKNFILRKTGIAEEAIVLYKEFKNEKFYGIYTFRTPTLFVRDPSLINDILISDFSNFHDRGFSSGEKASPLSMNLFNLNGIIWKNLKKKLTPVFTSGKLKHMKTELDACAQDLVQLFDDKTTECSELEMTQVMTRFTAKVIGLIAFGCELDTLNDPNLEFIKYGEQVSKITYKALIALFAAAISPKLMDFLGIKSIRQDVEDFFLNFVKDTVAFRVKNNYVRNDFLQLLINLRKEDASGASSYLQNEHNGSTKSENKPMILDDTLMAANLFIFFVAGFETTASTLSYCLLELAANPEVQEKLRHEIHFTIKNNENVTYEVVKDMKYLEKVISEILRKYSVFINIHRICTKKYKIPGTDIVLDEGVKIVIPAYAIHRDPQYYPDPEKFDPERFNEENIKKRPHGTYLPFGDGPRICIALRFALLEMKVALIHVLPRFQFSLTDKMAYPLEFSKNAFLLAPKDGIWLNVTKIKQ